MRRGGLQCVQIELVVETDDGMVGSCSRDLTSRRASLVAVSDEEFPFVRGILESVEVECN